MMEQIGNATIHTGDCLAVLRALPAGSVDCCVTSPPYWGLRDYGTRRVGGRIHQREAACRPVPRE